MAKLSVSTAWSETAAFMKREAGLVLPIAFLLLALPGAALQLSMPAPPSPGASPEIGLWLLLLPIMLVVNVIGSVAISHLALRPGSSVAEALQVGLRRCLPLILASLLLGVAVMLLITLLALALLGGSITQIQSTPAAVIGPLLVVFVITAIISLALWCRLMLMTPAAASENIGPIGIIRRSWALTAGSFWKLLGLSILLVILTLVITLAVSSVIGIVLVLLAGPPEPGSVAMIAMVIISALLQAVVSAVIVTLVARIYVQLSGSATPEVFA